MDNVRVNNTSEFQTRLGARLLDGLILGVPLHIIGILIFGTGIYDSNDPISYKASSFGSLFFLAYDVGMWVFADGATIGKKILKIKIVKNDGTPLTFGSALVRWFSYIIAAIPCGYGLLWVLWDKEGLGWHDKIANTKVIPAGLN